LKLLFELIKEDEARIPLLKYIDFCSVSSSMLKSKFEKFQLDLLDLEAQQSIWKRLFRC
jgi:hypothetical protein